MACVMVTFVSKGVVKIAADRSRKWQLTINNPIKHGFSHDVIKDKLGLFKSCVYWCMSDEVGDNGTYHTHIFIALSNASRFDTVKERFPPAYIEYVKGTCQQNRDYIFKEGKWEKDKKKETNLPDTHEEWGEMPVERQGARNDLADLKDMIKAGLSDAEIIEVMPQYMLQIDKIDRVRQILKSEEFREVWRKLEVVYIFGSTGTGKTRSVMEEFGYRNVFRITDYLHPFDNYKGQPVVAFEEFRSSLKIQDMLNYLDCHPLDLPSRYNNKVACFEKVFIITNIDLSRQYEDIQQKYPETWNAFVRRINKVVRFGRECREELDIEQYEIEIKQPAGKIINLNNEKNEQMRVEFRRGLIT